MNVTIIPGEYSVSISRKLLGISRCCRAFSTSGTLSQHNYLTNGLAEIGNLAAITFMGSGLRHQQICYSQNV